MTEDRADILIRGGVVVTMTDDDPPIRDGFVMVSEGAVLAVGAMSDLPPETTADREIDAGGCLIMPGLINTHLHGAMTMFRGLADDLPLMTWLQDYIFPAEAQHVNEDLVYWGTKLACAEMLLAGTTGVADSYFLADHSVRAVHETGLRGIVAQGVIDYPAPGVPDPSKNLNVARAFVERWRGISPLITPSIFCHSPYTCSPETMTGAKKAARDAGVLFQVHVSETAAEVDQSREERGMPPVRYLDSLGVLDEATLAVHCVHINGDEIDLLAERRTAVAICMESNMKLASGLAPVPDMMEKNIRLGLGTDGPASNNDLSIFGEMRSLALAYKVAGLDPTVVPAVRALRTAGAGGAEALGWGGLVGVIAPGMRADLVILDVNLPNMKPIYRPRSHVVYAATGREVRTVLVDGRVLVDNGRLTTLDLAEVMARTREIARSIGGRA